MADSVGNKLIYWDGMKSFDLEEYPPEAWTFYSNQPDQASDVYRQAVPWVYRAEQVRAFSVMNMPFSLYKGTTEITSSADYDNKIGILPNPKQLLQQIEMSLINYGRAYILKTQNKARVLSLKYLAPTSIEPILDPVNGLTGFVRTAGSQRIEYKPQDIIYFWPVDASIEIGAPRTYPLKSALHAAGVLANVDTMAEMFFGRGAIKPTILSVKGNPPMAEREKLKTWWQRFTGGIRNAYSAEVVNADQVVPVVIGEGLESLRDNDLTRQKREDIAAAYGIPFAILFSDAANYATALQDWRGFYDTTINPECEFIGAVLDEQLFWPMGYRIEFVPESLDVYKTDENERSGSLAALVNSGVPLLMAMDLLGYDLTKEQRAELEAAEAEKKERAEEMTENLTKPAEPEAEPEAEEPDEPEETEAPYREELRRWERKAINALKRGKSAAVEFESNLIPAELSEAVTIGLHAADNAEDVRDVFNDLEKRKPARLGYDELIAELRRANDLLERADATVSA